MNKYYWSRAPGKHVDMHTGIVLPSNISHLSPGEWYTTLTDCISHIYKSQKHIGKKQLLIIVSPEVRTIFEHMENYTILLNKNLVYNKIGYYKSKKSNSFYMLEGSPVDKNIIELFCDNNQVGELEVMDMGLI